MATLATKPQRSPVDRREFLSGAWSAKRDASCSGPVVRSERIDVIIQARPARIAEIADQLKLFGPVRVGDRRDPAAQRHIHLSLAGTNDIAGTLDAIATIPGVLAATLASTALSQGGA